MLRRPDALDIKRLASSPARVRPTVNSRGCSHGFAIDLDGHVGVGRSEGVHSRQVERVEHSTSQQPHRRQLRLLVNARVPALQQNMDGAGGFALPVLQLQMLVTGPWPFCFAAHINSRGSDQIVLRTDIFVKHDDLDGADSAAETPHQALAAPVTPFRGAPAAAHSGGSKAHSVDLYGGIRVVLSNCVFLGKVCRNSNNTTSGSQEDQFRM